MDFSDTCLVMPSAWFLPTYTCLWLSVGNIQCHLEADFCKYVTGKYIFLVFLLILAWATLKNVSGQIPDTSCGAAEQQRMVVRNMALSQEVRKKSERTFLGIRISGR